MDLRTWIEGAVVVAIAMTLSFLSVEFANSGLDLSLGMVPLVLYSFRRELLPGVAAGFAWDMLNVILGIAMKDFLSVPQTIFEYPFAFAFGGIGDVLAKKIQPYFQANRLRSVIRTTTLGGVVIIFARWFWHFWAGVLVWGMYASEGMSPYLYSFVLNGTSAVIDCSYVSLVLDLLARVAPQLFVPKK